MIILLEPGMKIKYGDEAYANEEWYSVDPYMTGVYYTDMHFPMKRKVETIQELLGAYNNYPRNMAVVALLLSIVLA